MHRTRPRLPRACASPTNWRAETCSPRPLTTLPSGAGAKWPPRLTLRRFSEYDSTHDVALETIGVALEHGEGSGGAGYVAQSLQYLSAWMGPH